VKLGLKQELFSRLECQIVPKANGLGYEVRGGEYLRFEQQARYNAEHCGICKKIKKNHTKEHRFRAIGIVNSVHRLKLAKDVILTKHGKVCNKLEDYVELGEWWEGLHPMCRWGGRFHDAYHFSLEHQGRR
jgi:hypothetical protein